MNPSLDAQDIHFILVRPNFLGNIGAVARACMNFGFENLRLVQAPKNYKDAEARKMAVGAFEVLKRAENFETLSDALQDMTYVIGTTAGQQRTQPLVSLSDSIEKIETLNGNKLAIVLGDERNGLTNDEMSLCHILVRIETSCRFPSMNVAQAACIIAYELSRSCTLQSSAPSQSTQAAQKTTLPTGKDNDELFKSLDKLLERIEFSRTFNKKVVAKEIRRFYHNANPTKRESKLLLGILHKLNQTLAAGNSSVEFGEE
ncbi:MAG: TrmJ/YjtD family RNA methyltransferase [Candidatus Obscuribacterales bacterium]